MRAMTFGWHMSENAEAASNSPRTTKRYQHRSRVVHRDIPLLRYVCMSVTESVDLVTPQDSLGVTGVSEVQ
jgi:hypothetical protein